MVQPLEGAQAHINNPSSTLTQKTLRKLTVSPQGKKGTKAEGRPAVTSKGDPEKWKRKEREMEVNKAKIHYMHI